MTFLLLPTLGLRIVVPANSSASCHMTNSDKDLTDVKTIDEFVKIGNGKEMRETKPNSSQEW